MDGANQSSEVCAVLGIDHSSLFYRACSLCERPLKDDPNCLCQHCHRFGSVNLPSSSKRLFRVLMSIATDEKVFTVICFDRVARVMFGCSADEFFEFLKFHPFAAATASKVLEGEVFIMKLSKPKNGNAQHVRVTSLVPMMSDYRPAIETLKEIYRVRSIASQSSMGTSSAIH
ncbi:hypothetical protein MLD38_039482 [Melastoma candidum]|uniref:Uncharacterized protein n=1 Tax=Melastoma candidum TaxID=119954 RepID=A0ACB9L3A5_9MYRT|nr:hypothetical protein MLD38_039482 [Melastoma candidum]